MTTQKELFPLARPELFLPNGVLLGEGVSTLIKEMRRGHVVAALYWADQLQERYEMYLWRRLVIFAAEDVSIANMHCVTAVRGLAEQYREQAKKDRRTGERADLAGSKMTIAAAVSMLASTAKCRESNWLWAMLAEHRKVGWRPARDRPGVYLEELLLEAIRDGDELDAAFFASILHVQQRSQVWEPLMWFSTREVAPKQPVLHGVVSSLKWGYELTERESGRHEGDLDCVSMAIMILARSPTTTIAMDAQDELDEFLAAGGALEVPEYALDGHTKRGRKKTPNRKERHRRWFTEWSKVEPNVGPHDAELWHLRRLADGGMIDAEVIDKLAAMWADEGSLVWPLEDKYPRIEGWSHE